VVGVFIFILIDPLCVVKGINNGINNTTRRLFLCWGKFRKVTRELLEFSTVPLYYSLAMRKTFFFVKIGMFLLEAAPCCCFEKYYDSTKG